MNRIRIIGSIIVFLAAASACAYDQTTHVILSGAAANQSILADQQALAELGLRHSIADPAQTYQDSKGTARTILTLIQAGAFYEDDGFRSINHFFDPRTGNALSLDTTAYASAAAVAAAAIVNASATPSPDFALGTALLSLPPNVYSYKNAHDYLIQALTNSSNAVRSNSFGLLFETLGRIIHHIQDMAQPQHVRNDAHLADDWWDKSCQAPLPPWLPQALCSGYAELRNPSVYEFWTQQFDSKYFRDNGFLTGYPAVYGPASDGLGTFTDPRRFWIYSGMGMAEFANRNFLSAGTMNLTPPVVGQPYEVSVSTICNNAVPACGAIGLDQTILFYPSTVDDQFRQSVGVNPYAAAASLFTPDLLTYYPNGPLIYTVNRITFESDYSYLLPRAVGYSAGLINYFFRGSMKIDLPDEGVYAIVDQSSSGCGTPCGFRKLKVKLTNLTPGLVGGVVTPGAEAMGAGTLLAVVQYHSNTCYKPDLSGEYDAPAFAELGNACRSPDELIVVSSAQSVNSVSSTDAQEVTFDFSDTPIPINASDVFLQIVFQGTLGQEDSAVAVTTKDISEPNYYALSNLTDYVFDPVLQQYFPLPYMGYTTPNVVTNIRFAFATNSAMTNSSAIASLDQLSGGEHAQFAVLLELGGGLASEEWNGDVYVPPGEQQPYDTEEFTMDDTGPYAGQYTRTCPVHLLRGVYRQYGLAFIQEVVAHRGAADDELGVLSPVGQGMTTGRGRARTKALVRPDCAPWPTTGLYDLSKMPSLNPATAKQWSINF